MSNGLQELRHGGNGEDEAREQNGGENGGNGREHHGDLLSFRDGGDEETYSQGCEDIENHGCVQQEQTAFDLNAEEDSAEGQDDESVQESQENVGYDFADYHFVRFERADEYLLQSAAFSFPGYGDGSQKRRDHHEDDCDQSWDVEHAAFEVRIEEDSCSNVEKVGERRLASGHNISVYDGFRVLPDDGGGIGIAAVDDDLDFRFFSAV